MQASGTVALMATERTEQTTVRLSAVERRHIRAAAGLAGQTQSAWMADTLARTARDELQRAGVTVAAVDGPGPS